MQGSTGQGSISALPIRTPSGVEEPDVEGDHDLEHPVGHHRRLGVGKEHPVGPVGDIAHILQALSPLIGGIGDQGRDLGVVDRHGDRLPGHLGAGSARDGQGQGTDPGQAEDLPLNNSAATSSATW